MANLNLHLVCFMARKRTGRAIENMPFETPQARQARIMILLATAMRRLNLRGPVLGGPKCQNTGITKNPRFGLGWLANDPGVISLFSRYPRRWPSCGVALFERWSTTFRRRGSTSQIVDIVDRVNIRSRPVLVGDARRFARVIITGDGLGLKPRNRQIGARIGGKRDCRCSLGTTLWRCFGKG